MTAVVTLAARPLPADPLPTSFRLLRFGRNPSYNSDAGQFPEMILTLEGARKIMADQANRPGVQWLLDLEHRSIDAAARAASNTASDAQAWFRLGLRSDGLYAVDVRFTPEGERRLRSRSQRFVSPVVRLDADGNVIEFINCALVSEPALHDAQELVAAGRQLGRRERLTRYDSEPIGVRLPTAAKAALIFEAERRGETLGAVVRRLLVAGASRGYPTSALLGKAIEISDLLDVLGLPDGTNDAELIHAAVDELLGSLLPEPDVVPEDPTAGTADPPKPAPLSRALMAKHVEMNPVQRDRFDRYRTSMARDRAAQQRQRGARVRPALTPVAVTLLAKMTRDQRARFHKIRKEM